jgi:hypothetical protein
MIGLLSVAQTVKPFILPSSIFPRVRAVKTDWFTREIVYYLTKVLLKVARSSYIHWWTSFNPQTVAQTVAILPSSMFPTFNCTSKTTGWFTKGAEIDPNLLKCYSKVARIHIHGWTAFIRQTVPSRCYLTFFHIPERSIALVNDWLVHQGWDWLTCPTNKVYSR